VSVENFTETLGFGVKGRIAGLDWSVSKDSLSTAKGNTLCVFREQQIVARLLLSDSPRPESISVVKKLAPLEVHLLTGDRREQSLALAKTLAIPPGNVHAEKSPEEKAEILAKNPGAVMVGDGFNDAIAFRQAAVGIAAHGSAEESLRNADIFFSRPGLKSLINVFAIARRNQKITRLNLFFSAAYNVIAGTFAILGLMTPLLAAVIMPISALTIFLITTFGIEGRNKK
jgi:P-type E1-E2 ATPase